MRGFFTLSYHYLARRDARNHLELFLDIDGESPLETWRCFEKRHRGQTARTMRFSAAPPHRRIYLEFAGKITGDRGKLRILRRGKFIDCRARKPEVRTAQDVHLGANRRAGKPEARYIKVTL